MSAERATPERVFSALGDPVRLALIESLCANGGASIAQLTAATTISRQAVTKHLRVLADAGLASDIRDGRARRWQFEPRALGEARHAIDLIGQQWDRALVRLRAAVETPGDTHGR